MGLVIVAFAIGGLIRPRTISDAVKDFDHESFARLLAGCVGIGFGVALITYHNIWTMDYRGLVTLFGWTSLVKGISYLIVPKQAVHFTKSMLKSKSQLQVFLVACLLLGGYLAYKGFGY